MEAAEIGKGTTLLCNEESIRVDGPAAARRVPWRPTVRVLVLAGSRIARQRAQALLPELRGSLPADTIIGVAISARVWELNGFDFTINASSFLSSRGARFAADFEGHSDNSLDTMLVDAASASAARVRILWLSRETPGRCGPRWDLVGAQVAALIAPTSLWSDPTVRAARRLLAEGS